MTETKLTMYFSCIIHNLLVVEECPRGVVANVRDCYIVVTVFEFKLRYYVHF